jgi:multiple sugar transport system permease protein
VATVDQAPPVASAWASRAATRKSGRTGRRRLSSAPANRNDWRLAWLLIGPAAVGFVLFAAYPLVRGVYLSFTSFHVLSPAKWTGLANLRQLLHDDTFWSSLRTTVYFVGLSVVFGILTSLDTQLGIVNNVLAKLTGHSVMFLGSTTWAVPSVAWISVWKSMGYNAILLFAGLQMIPTDVYEAARLDGAGEFTTFRRITVPLLRPVLVMVVILAVISSFQVFDIVQVTTQGGPANASMVLQMYIYNKAFTQFDFGYASTMSLALFAMLIAITFMQMRMARANESDTN